VISRTVIEPDSAIVKSGAGLREPLIISGGYCWAWPCWQQVQTLDLRVMTLDVNSPQVYTKQGVPVTVNSIAQVKIGNQKESLITAAGAFLGMSKKDIAKAAEETLEGHQRAILGTMTVEEIFQDREKFASEVRDVAVDDVKSMGLEIVSFTIRDISDSEGYLQSLGKKRTAEVKRDAKIGEAEAERDAGVREAEANREKMAKVYEAETAIADAERKFNLQKAAFDKEVNSEQAKATMAYELQVAKSKQDIKKEEMEVNVVQRKKEIEVEEQEILRKEKELEATVKLPASAESYRMGVIAEGQRTAKIKKATAEANATTLIGQAEADVIKKLGEAEAIQMTAKASAWKQYSKGAYLEMIINELPAMTGMIAEPLSKVKNITMVSTGGDDIGASRLTSEVSRIMAQVPPLIKQITGIDLIKQIMALEA